MRNPVRLTYALALRCGFPTHMSQPLGALDIFSRAWRPTQTAHLWVFSSPSEGRSLRRVVSHCRLRLRRSEGFDASYLRCASKTTTQPQAAVKLNGVFTSP